MREDWFSRRTDRKGFINLVDRFYLALVEFLDLQLDEHRLYLPEGANLSIAPNMLLRAGARLKASRKGIVGPPWFGVFHRKYFNLLHRLNRFVFEVPFENHQIPDIIEARYRALATGIDENRSGLRSYMFPASPLNVFKLG